jgi:hypothetical protein
VNNATRYARAQDTMRPSHLINMASCNFWALPPPGSVAPRGLHVRLCLLYFISSLDDYKSYPTLKSYPCLSLHHPLVGCHHLPYTTLRPLYQILVSPHIYNSLTSSPSHGSHIPSFLSFLSRSAFSCPQTRHRRLYQMPKGIFSLAVWPRRKLHPRPQACLV